MPAFDTLLNDPVAQLGYGLLVAGAPGGDMQQGFASALGLMEAGDKRKRQAKQDEMQEKLYNLKVMEAQSPKPKLFMSPTGQLVASDPYGMGAYTVPMGGGMPQPVTPDGELPMPPSPGGEQSPPSIAKPSFSTPVARAEYEKKIAERQAQKQFPTPAEEKQGMELEGLQKKKEQFITDAGREYQRVQQLISHPGFETSVGWKGYEGAGGLSYLNPWQEETKEGQPVPISGTDAADWQSLYQQVKSGAFLQGFQAMKGAGTITEVEGEKAEQAITRMKQAQSEKAFKEAANEYMAIIDDAVLKSGGQLPIQANIPQQAIQMLQQNPGLSLQFEQKYGVAAQRFLGR